MDSFSRFPRLLSGIRVLDASRVLAGPFCGQFLADLGADVVKIERPGTGDETRFWGPPFLDEDTSAYYLSCNRGKRGITLDLAASEGQAVFRRLTEGADVVLENFLPAGAKKLGLDACTLHAINPRLVVCSISGFGRTGPWSDRPGYDFAIQALSGLMSITGHPGMQPSKVGVAVADVFTGLYAAASVLAALIARGKSGHGYAIDLSLLDCCVAAQVNVVQAYLTRVQQGDPSPVPATQGNAHLQIVPYQLFATADGWMVVAVGNDSQWARFATVAVPDLGADAAFATNPDRVRRRAELVPRIEAVMRTRTTAEWQALLEAAGVPYAPLWTYADLFAQPLAQARGLRVTVTDSEGRPVDLAGCPVHAAGAEEGSPRCPPRQGQHTEEILTELGMNAEEIAGLRRRGVV